MSSADKRIGKDHKLYVSTTILADLLDLTIDAAPWVEFLLVDSTDNSLERESIQFKTRENSGQQQTCPGALINSIELSWVYKKNDATQEAICTALKDGTNIAIADVDGDVTATGTDGVIGNYSVLSFNQSKPVDGVVQVTVTCEPSDSVFDPCWTHG